MRLPHQYHLLLVRLVLCAAALLAAACESFRGTEISADIPTASIDLIDQNRQAFTLGDYKGKVVLLFFGYTFCPDACPVTLAKWKQVEQALKERSKEVTFVYITVDPERDTPERLKTHLEIFSPDFIGLTGSEEKLEAVYSAYGVYRDRNYPENSAVDYLYSHTSKIFIIDREGKWRVLLPYEASVRDILHDIRLLL